MSEPDADVLAAIPHRPPFLFVDAIEDGDGERLRARRTFRAEEDFYAGHYPGRPITPGVLLCEAVFQCGAILLARRAAVASGGPPAGVPLLAKVEDTRFRSPVWPGETITIEVRLIEVVAGFHRLAGEVRVGARRVLTTSFAVAWKAPDPVGGGA